MLDILSASYIDNFTRKHHHLMGPIRRVEMKLGYQMPYSNLRVTYH